MPIVKLTQNFIKELHCPDGKSRIEYCDSELPGLYIEVRATSQGAGTAYLRYKDASRISRHQRISRVGSGSDVCLTDLRNRARIQKAQIELGADPRGAEKAKKAVLTYSDFFLNHYLPYVTPRKRSWKSDESLFRVHLQPAFGDKRLNQITRQQIQLFHTELKKADLAAATCNHPIKLLRASLSLAINWDMLETNPAAKVPLFPEMNAVENYLDDTQLKSLLSVLHIDENRPVCLIALFLLSTSCRLNEILKAKWSDVDTEKRILLVRATNSKNKKLRSVPLNDSALDVLKQLPTAGKFEHLFVNVRTGKPYTAIFKVWNRLRKKAGVPVLRLHDLRHLGASFMINSGRTLFEVQSILGHADPRVTMRYAHLSTKTMQDASNCVSAAITGAMKVPA